jgi:tRNA(fMet)-specific endonuclease VapC
VSDFINNRGEVRNHTRTAKRAGSQIGTCPPALAELYYGLELSATRDQNLRLARAGIADLKLWPFDHAAAKEYGRLFAHLRRTGRLMQEIDVMIAAIALTLSDCAVVSSDSDLLAVPGLAVENWAV